MKYNSFQNDNFKIIKQRINLNNLLSEQIKLIIKVKVDDILQLINKRKKALIKKNK